MALTYIQLMGKRYDPYSYHCGHFACDMWYLLTGQAISSELAGILLPLDVAGVPVPALRRMTRLQLPTNPCIAVLTSNLQQRHLGIYNFGKLLHLQEDYPECTHLNIAMRYYNRIRYYAPKEN